MVYKGRPSSGCENCRYEVPSLSPAAATTSQSPINRKSKKLCDEQLPACSRCVRLGKACGGYRDVSDLIFKNETESVARRASAQSEAGTAGPSTITRHTTPEVQTVAIKFFFEQFVTPGHMSYLQGITPDEFLLKPIIACALVAMATRDGNEAQRELARSYYVEAITATNVALRHPRKVREDNTLIAVYLLSIFERLIWDRDGRSNTSWRQHIKGAAQVLRHRGRSQIRHRTGALIFRDLRDMIINRCLLDEHEVPDYFVPWTQALQHDPMHAPADQLSILSTRLANLRAAFRTASKADEEISEQAKALEKAFHDWSESTLSAGSICSFHNVLDPDSPHAWNGTRHEYGIPQAHRKWNTWRCGRITLSRLQEAIWRRSWPTLTQPQTPIPSSEHFVTIRNRMVSDICIAAAYALGNSPDIDPPAKGSVSSGILLMLPLVVAGTCLLEQLSQPVMSPGGSRMILVDEPLHCNPFNPQSVQLAWIIERLEYIGSRVGVNWAVVGADFLKGQKKFYYDLGRSQILNHFDFDAQCVEEILDLENTMTLSDLSE